jgi:hypothetical protein
VRRFAAFDVTIDAGSGAAVASSCRTPIDAGGGAAAASSCRTPFDASKLAEVKHITIALESALSVETPAGTGRTVNIDPGYVTLSKVILATTKDYSHRVYLRDGIFAEVTLYYKDGAFRPHVFTYRDYVEPEAIKFFTRTRGLLKGK